mgnify:CR=1 FL=1
MKYIFNKINIIKGLEIPMKFQVEHNRHKAIFRKNNI